MRPRQRWAALAACLVALGVLAAVLCSLCDGTFWPITNPGRYAAIAGRYREIAADDPVNGSVLLGFPGDVPPGATHVRFHYQTPPGDVDLELRYTLPPADAASLLDRVRRAALSTARGMEQASGRYQGAVDLHLFYVGDTPAAWHLPEAYSVCATATARQADGDDQWNYEAGVAAEPVSGDVIYWLEGHAGPAGVAPGTRP